MMGIAVNHKSDLFDIRRGTRNFDLYVRVSTEALIVHTWYCDSKFQKKFWDVRSDDPHNWNSSTFRKLIAILIRDRNVPRRFETGTNRCSAVRLLLTIIEISSSRQLHYYANRSQTGGI